LTKTSNRAKLYLTARICNFPTSIFIEVLDPPGLLLFIIAI